MSLALVLADRVGLPPQLVGRIDPAHGKLNMAFRSVLLVALVAVVEWGHAAVSDAQNADPGGQGIGGRAASEVFGAGTKAGDTREITLSGGVKLKQVWCPPGTFTMGTPGATNTEAPVQVTLKGYWLAATETTQGQYTALMGTTPWGERDSTDYYYKVGANFPASYIDHTAAEAYCEKLTELERKAGRLPTGWKYALPTEAQWEYACRAGTKTAYSFGDDESQLGEYAWFKENADDINEDYAHTVGTKKPNPWGLSDMHGNAWEWCADVYEAKLPGGSDPLVVSADGAALRVFRGGGWLIASVRCRSAYRRSGLPTYRGCFLGFRPATVPVGPD